MWTRLPGSLAAAWNPIVSVTALLRLTGILESGLAGSQSALGVGKPFLFGDKKREPSEYDHTLHATGRRRQRGTDLGAAFGKDPLQVLGIEEFLMRDPSLQHLDETVRILLISAQREADLEEFR